MRELHCFKPRTNTGASREKRGDISDSEAAEVVSSQVRFDASLLRVAHVRACSLFKSRSTLLSHFSIESLFDDSQPSHYRRLAEMYVVRGSASCLLAHRSPGLKEEDSSPTRNAYKVRSFQVAIAAIHEHDKPIRSGQEAIEVRPAWFSLDPFR
jgi:hypothetical protein